MACVRVPRLIVDYFAYAVRLGASATHAARCRLLRLHCTSVCLGSSRSPSSTTSARRAARRQPRAISPLDFSKSHWLSSCAQSLRLAARVLVVRLHRLYCTYDVHPDAPSRRSTSRRSIALALVVRPVTLSHGSTSSPLNLLSGRTGSTSTLPCAASTRYPAARALCQPCRAPRVFATWLHRLYVNLAVHRGHLPPAAATLHRLRRMP
jgi:hypothetical protein